MCPSPHIDHLKGRPRRRPLHHGSGRRGRAADGPDLPLGVHQEQAQVGAQFRGKETQPGSRLFRGERGHVPGEERQGDPIAVEEVPHVVGEHPGQAQIPLGHQGAHGLPMRANAREGEGDEDEDEGEDDPQEDLDAQTAKGKEIALHPSSSSRVMIPSCKALVTASVRLPTCSLP